jgi:cation:H+ antiporter
MTAAKVRWSDARGSASVTPSGASVPVSQGALGFDFPVMIGVAVATLPVFFTRYTIARWEGAVFFAYYLAYTAYLILAATGHRALPTFSAALAYFVIPLTALTLIVFATRAARDKRAG